MGNAPVHAISIKQPFVEQILQRKKHFEYRSRATKITGTVFLYASSTPRTGLPASQWNMVGKTRDDVDYGVVVGTIEIIRCIERSPRGFAYALKNPVRFKTPRRPKKPPRPQPCFWRPRF